MSRRMVLLLVALAIAIVIATVRFWPEPSKPPHLGSLSVDDLVAQIVENRNPLGATGELAQRGWLGGPATIEPFLSHPDPAVRRWLLFALPPGEVDVSPHVAHAWEHRLIRLMIEDSDVGVREAAVMMLAILVREDHLAATPRLVAAIRRMIRSDDGRVRSLGCACAMHLGEDARPLVPDLLAIDSDTGDDGRAARMLVPGVLEMIGEVDDAAVDYLLSALHDEDPDMRAAAASALGTAGGDEQRVAAALAKRWRDEREVKEVRARSLVARARSKLSEPEARALLLEALPRRALFDSDTSPVFDATQWATIVADLAVTSSEAEAQRSAIDALRAEFRARPEALDETVLTAATTRIAVALADAALVDAAMPDLLDCVEITKSLNWLMPDVQALELVLAALVDVCRWRNDGQLRMTVDDALREVGEHGYRAERDWARAQRQRLHG